jgi:hypothetical protein
MQPPRQGAGNRQTAVIRQISQPRASRPIHQKPAKPRAHQPEQRRIQHQKLI